ncbi:Oidioi.mRNA.OKI2018_I69.XSR.g16252.t1.cds [Oikopleura dioica]|uniref:Oidioi.mRNA.OKI2018_I69.XSR.g16252.t1.cds n=1 Tax=Oikopleura dioica TaxID=34765 RepID=A0ABN7SMU9_OIKDI|nr:Oidioi.mRNA.OKI2018_I69.XSR.g16252.t1.cds [Oikopleura dioica]
MRGPNVRELSEEMDSLLQWLENEKHEKISNKELLCLAIVYERRKEQVSKCFGYIQQLPSFYTCPIRVQFHLTASITDFRGLNPFLLVWLDSELDLLPQTVREAVKKTKQNLRTDFSKLLETESEIKKR